MVMAQILVESRPTMALQSALGAHERSNQYDTCKQGKQASPKRTEQTYKLKQFPPRWLAQRGWAGRPWYYK